MKKNVLTTFILCLLLFLPDKVTDLSLRRKKTERPACFSKKRKSGETKMNSILLFIILLCL